MAFRHGQKLLDVGNGNTVARDRIISIVAYDSDPTRRHCSELEKTHRAIDATRGKKVKSVIFLDSGHVVLSSIARETLSERLEEGSTPNTLTHSEEIL